MVLSANASPGEGGQGLNLRDMAEAARVMAALELFARARYPGVRTHEVPPSRAAAVLGRIPYARRLSDYHGLMDTRAFDRHVAARLPPAEIVQGGSGTCLRTFASARKSGSRCVLDCVTTHIDNVIDRHREASASFGLRSPIHSRVRDVALAEYDAADVVRVMSQHAWNTFVDRGYPADRLVVVRPVIEHDDFPPTHDEPDSFRVLFVGRLVPLKGFRYLVEAYEQLALSDAQLELWGGPTSRSVAAYLKASLGADPSASLRPEAVRTAGFEEAYGRASVLVHPSMADAFGYVVAEAMACGVPVVVSDQTGAAELVEDGVSGYVVPAGDSAAIADRLRHLHGRPALVREMGEAARMAVAPLTAEAFSRRYLSGVLGLGASGGERLASSEPSRPTHRGALGD